MSFHGEVTQLDGEQEQESVTQPAESKSLVAEL